MFETFGDSFGITGTFTFPFTAAVNSRTASGSSAISVPRPFACGHERFSSIAWTPYPWRAFATLAYSSGSLPNTLPITTAPPSSAISASGPKSFIPGFGRPIALSKPTSSSRIVGFVFPARGFGPIDFVTTAPAPAWNTRRSVPPVSSRKPDASIVGFRSFNPARVVSTLGIIEGSAESSLSLPRRG